MSAVKKYRVGVYRCGRGADRPPFYIAYLRESNMTMRGCAVVEVQAFSGPDAKRRAIAKVRGDVDLEALREFESRMP